MLKIKLINEQATLNNFSFVENKEYLVGQPLSILIQVQDSETKQRLIPATNANLSATFQKRDGTEMVIAGTMLFSPDDRSMWKIDLNSTQVGDLVGSNFRVDLDFNGSAVAPPVLSTSTNLKTGMAYNVLSKVTFDGEC